MSGLKDISTQQPAKRPAWVEPGGPLEFDLFAPTCAILGAEAVRPLGSYLANLSALPESLISRFLPAPDTAALAILCRALGLTRHAFEALTLCCSPTLGKVCLAPASALFDALSRARAERIVNQWRLSEPASDRPACFPILGPHYDA